MKKIYYEPVVDFILDEESNKVFFAGSGNPGVKGSFSSMMETNGSW